MTARFLIAALVIAALGCSSNEPSGFATVDEETAAVLVAGETAGWVLRLVAAGVADPLDWTGGKQELEQETLQRIEAMFGRLRCAEFQYPDERSLMLTFDGCRLISRNIEGSVNFTVEVEPSADPRVSLDIELPSLSWPNGVFRGSGSLTTTKSTFGSFEGDLHIHHDGEISFDFEADGQFASVEKSEVIPCIEVNALGLVQSKTASVAISFHDALYCSGACGEAGGLVGAGRYLQKLKFSERSATRAVDDGPAVDVPACISR